MRYFFVFFLLILASTALVWWYRRLTDQRSDRLHGLLQQLQDRYERFMKQRLMLAYIKEDAWQDERKKLVDEALEILKPNLDALAAQVSGHSFQAAELNFDSPVFNNVAAEAEALAQQRGTTRAESRQELYRSFRDAMRADLANRWLEYQVGDRLSPQ